MKISLLGLKLELKYPTNPSSPRAAWVWVAPLPAGMLKLPGELGVGWIRVRSWADYFCKSGIALGLIWYRSN